MDKIKQYGIFNTSIWRGSLKIRCVRKRSKDRNNFASRTDRKQPEGSGGRAIALLRKSRLFRGKSIINNNRTLDLTLTLSLSLSLSSTLSSLASTLKPHPLSPPLFAPVHHDAPPHPIAFQDRSSHETEVKTRNKV